MGEVTFSRQEHTNSFSSDKRLVLKINIWVAVYGINRLHLGIYMYITYIYACNNNY